jgi:hypothetical protein
MMHGVGVVSHLIVPEMGGTLRSPYRVYRTRSLKGGWFDALGRRTPVHNAGGPERL